MKKYQDIVNTWIKTYGKGYFKEMTNLAHLMEEVGELARYMARVYGEQSFKNSEEKDNPSEKIEDELTDIFFVCFCLANQMNIDLDKAFHNNIIKKTERDRTRHLNNKKL